MRVDDRDARESFAHGFSDYNAALGEAGARTPPVLDPRRMLERMRPLLLVTLTLTAAAASAQSLGAGPGAKLFDAYCTACHKYDGQGMGQAPPLDGSEWVAGPEERLIKIVLHGVRGEMTVQGRTYDREMPGFGAVLSDKQIADLLTIVRRTFGEPSPAITETSVRRVRERHAERRSYWRVEDLRRP